IKFFPPISNIEFPSFVFQFYRIDRLVVPNQNVDVLSLADWPLVDFQPYRCRWMVAMDFPGQCVLEVRLGMENRPLLLQCRDDVRDTYIHAIRSDQPYQRSLRVLALLNFSYAV